MNSPPVAERETDPDTDTDTDTDTAAFSAVYDEFAPRVFAYARRHCNATDAQDVVADTFLVAWRRRSRVPHDDPLPWLLVVARNTIHNQQRSSARRRNHSDALARVAHLATPPDPPDRQVAEREAMLAALAELSDLEREAVLLVAWDGLSNAAAASVADCSQRAFEVRLSRARARLARLLDEHPTDVSSPRTVRKAR